ncbi:MAG: DUF4266 domain-containing protein [Planctomycetota bacterium]|jgi:hypothetical protein|nr:DUF4266 domain-containing protein [Planctomycetota bacterium]
MKRTMILIVVAALGVAASGCNLTRVQAYEREDLSKRSMQLPPSALDARLDDHTYFSKEAARGGRGGGGGGCGCN